MGIALKILLLLVAFLGTGCAGIRFKPETTVETTPEGDTRFTVMLARDKAGGTIYAETFRQSKEGTAWESEYVTIRGERIPTRAALVASADADGDHTQRYTAPGIYTHESELPKSAELVVDDTDLPVNSIRVDIDSTGGIDCIGGLTGASTMSGPELGTCAAIEYTATASTTHETPTTFVTPPPATPETPPTPAPQAPPTPAAPKRVPIPSQSIAPAQPERPAEQQQNLKQKAVVAQPPAPKAQPPGQTIFGPKEKPPRSDKPPQMPPPGSDPPASLTTPPAAEKQEPCPCCPCPPWWYYYAVVALLGFIALLILSAVIILYAMLGRMRSGADPPG